MYSVFIPLLTIQLSFLIVLIILKNQNSKYCYKIPFFDNKDDYKEFDNVITDDELITPIIRIPV